MYSQWMLGLLVGMVCFSSAYSSGGSDKVQKCIDECNFVYTQQYRDCRGIKECEDYVEQQALLCIKHCKD